MVYLRIPVPVFVFGGAGRRDQGGIYNLTLAHRHAPCAEVPLDGFLEEVFCVGEAFSKRSS